ncbi:Nicotinamide phosphoribosyltransferase [Vibrio nigripulchritudo SFn27]|nr:nicotinate phosphoribosyltransferase [Vibrio nigripulchritudo]CCN83957.1 Nicotinamide phosphoribosyltransferase [Vibrio nigripulchritudo BLFn1]CCN89373.1 Nicotinamide phosphoribosyltransferase [Vibrio nigripulchritudo SFn27]CCN92972.1 Nicotinamide phosphoribosyltransferase [Vibrio nigripulchritudo ENn2]CCO40497.1 Nicotinamide phosphoribosyltransferase [Vibrio nigripulchritudo SFn135]CCO55783.1 Nicotinamide phosphoribosyltransferase [Vibrio nigripulchritudo Wn13]
MNIILNTDSYKASHYLQYPPKTEFVSSYIESRGGEYPQGVYFGLQMFLDQYLSKPLSQEDIDEAKAVLTAHGEPFNEEGWQYILDTHNGYLPVEIQALPEGSVVPPRTPLVQIQNTDPKCAWLTSYLETALLRAVWYPTTVASKSFAIKSIIRRYLEETADSLDGLPFKLHDFGARGAASNEAASIGGLAHLLNFMGTDTVSALVYARRYYNEDIAGYSIPAAEHSTITAWGQQNEKLAYQNMLEQFAKPGSLVAVVSDSYDLFHAIDHIWGDELKEKVEQSGGTLVVRPDSGNPVEIVAQTIERLMAKFGESRNSKGFRMLPDCVRVIQGDGISKTTIESILSELKSKEISADNLAFGMGAELLQKVNRDTMKFAMKASAICIDGKWHDVYKDPATDPNKASRKGRLAVIEASNWETVREDELNGRENALQVVFKDGKVLKRHTLQDIRERIQTYV